MTKRVKRTQSVPELYADYLKLRSDAKLLYDKADTTLAKLVTAWKKDKMAKIDEQHYLLIEDNFRGKTKAFAPGFAHRYNLKEYASD